MTTKLFNGEIEVLKVPELAKKLQAHPVTILRYIRSGKLHARKIGRRYYVSKESLRAFINGVDKEK